MALKLHIFELFNSLQFNHKIAHDTTIYVVRSRYISGVGALFTLIMGPYSGAQFVAATMETDFYTTASLNGTALHYAAGKGHVECVHALLDAGATDKEGS